VDGVASRVERMGEVAIGEGFTVVVIGEVKGYGEISVGVGIVRSIEGGSSVVVK
jgi:hypothetical protein